ncbi:MAG: hypothetical protein ACXAEN_27430 [Candidatus Thorarchaeota archaeon]
MVQDKGHEPKEAKMNQGGGHKTYKLGHKTYKLKQDPKEHAFAHLGEYPYTYIGYQYLTYQACPRLLLSQR